MSGQYLYPYERRGFPWRAFEIRETAHSHFFFGLKRVSDRLKPSIVRKSLTWNEMKRLGVLSAHWKLIDVPFEDLRQLLTSRPREHATHASQTSALVSATASRRGLLFTGILTVVSMAFFAFGLYLGFSNNWFVTWGCRLALVFFPLAFLDFASRRYDFGPSLLRYRSWFLWRSVPIPPAIAIRLIPDGKIRIANADNRQLIVELTREFAGGGMRADELADFYRRHDRKVVMK